MANVTVEIDECTVKALVIDHLSKILNVALAQSDVKFEVKATMNYRSEWEVGKFRATVVKAL